MKLIISVPRGRGRQNQRGLHVLRDVFVSLILCLIISEDEEEEMESEQANGQ